ncbi:hypothetical protein C9374_005030 [Naegleria lovaniensis]|uniref:Uncharacterized protein n=1 Tax=Naegleria lovaniensis TaxID=51637 RepID=A0AA88GLI9_NAELO|nr:uncharacterized protein C9374_005030 [Naegleria lovaniensis]KAG2382450.1 hypothetical protein C9374_005030 [Naegleria lovaniensis]
MRIALTLVLILLLGVSVQLIPRTFVHATTSECRHPEDENIRIKKPPVVLHYDNTEEESLISAETTSENTLRTFGTPRVPVDTSRIETALVRGFLSQQANEYIFLNPYRYSVTGPTNLNLIDRQAFKGRDSTPCVACRLDCLGSGSIFSKCRNRYYYYGCRKKAPCFNPLTAKRTIIETGIGICIDKNGCVLKATGIKPGQGRFLLNKVIKTVRLTDLEIDRNAEL